MQIGRQNLGHHSSFNCYLVFSLWVQLVVPSLMQRLGEVCPISSIVFLVIPFIILIILL